MSQVASNDTRVTSEPKPRQRRPFIETNFHKPAKMINSGSEGLVSKKSQLTFCFLSCFVCKPLLLDRIAWREFLPTPFSSPSILQVSKEIHPFLLDLWELLLHKERHSTLFQVESASTKIVKMVVLRTSIQKNRTYLLSLFLTLILGQANYKFF